VAVAPRAWQALAFWSAALLRRFRLDLSLPEASHPKEAFTRESFRF